LIRTSEITGANQLLQLFEWDEYFDFKQIYPGCKVNHFQKIERHFNCTKNRMMFFDDEQRNIDDLAPLGVHCVYVEQGVTKKLVLDSIENAGLKTAK
jgi:magnesium-dependent phosphatase 1